MAETRILKFGGTSVGSATAIEQVIDIIRTAQADAHVPAVVLSAFSGVTDQLLDVGRQAARGDTAFREAYGVLVNRHGDVAKALLKDDAGDTLKIMEPVFGELRDVLKGVFLVREMTPRVADLLMSFGERLSCLLVARAMVTAGISATFLDARQLICTDASFGNAAVNFDETNRRIAAHFQRHADLQVVTGFISATPRRETTTLGRGGSDYTASILAAALNATLLEIWTDVNGVLTSDPRKVPTAFSIDRISYEEAMEMSHFGAKVIYPPTMQPVLDKQIPICIRNTFNPSFPGTMIGKAVPSAATGIKGISSMPHISLLTLQGSGMVGVTGTAERLFRSLSRAGINVLLITQASSEHSICIGVSPPDGQAARTAIEGEFQLEITTGRIEPVILEEQLAVLAVVGDNMRQIPGIAGRLFQAVGREKVNIKAIAQGASERNISLVISHGTEEQALNAIHRAFFPGASEGCRIYLAGSGMIASELLGQMAALPPADQLPVAGMINSRRMFTTHAGLAAAEALACLNDEGAAAALSDWTADITATPDSPAIFVDCTASDAVSAAYLPLLKRGVSVVTANKRACAGPLKAYRQLQAASANSAARFLYETTVGAGLPVISTLRDLVATGDRILKIEGVLSGTLSYIFNRFDGTMPFSEVVAEARDRGYTEPDPREDLNGMDMARKLLILARESGAALDLADLDVEDLVPEGCREAASAEDFIACLEEHDGGFTGRLKSARQQGKKLRYAASFAEGHARVALLAVAPDNPLYYLGGNENMVVITSDRYQAQPLVIRGPGAGAAVTAAGVLADILRTAAQLRGGHE